MAPFKHAGGFRELRHGEPAGESIHDAVANPLPQEDRVAVAAYLRAGAVLAATSERTDDVLDPSRTQVSGINLCTDAEWTWTEDLAYYVETYGARIPEELLGRARGGIAPEVPQERLREMADRFVEQMGADE